MLGINPPKTHDLDELCKMCLRYYDQFKDVLDHCSDLTVYGVQPRYPMEMIIEEQDMKVALNSAKAIQNLVLTLSPEIEQS